MRLKSNRKSQKLSPLYKIVENILSVSSLLNVACGRDGGNLTLSTLGKLFSRRQFEISFSLIFPPKNRIRHFMQIVSHRDNLQEMSNPAFFFSKKKKHIISLSSAQFAQSSQSLNEIVQQKLGTRMLRVRLDLQYEINRKQPRSSESVLLMAAILCHNNNNHLYALI